MAKMDYYVVLGIAKEANKQQIKSAYRKLAKKYHPDTHPNDRQAERMFKEVTEAYNVLSDEKKKELYDKFGHAAFDGSMGDDPEAYAREREQAMHFYDSPYGETAGSRSGAGADFFSDLFGNSFQWEAAGTGPFGFGDHFSSGNGGSSRDTVSELSISFREAALGCEKMIRPETENADTLAVRIPAGINEGQSVRLKGKGRIGKNGARGDLLLKIHIRDDDKYVREGQNVFITQEIPYTTAVLGGEAVFDTLYGPVKCHVPAGSRAGSKIRLRGKGIVSMKNKAEHGDEYVTIQIHVPRRVSEKEKELLQKLEMFNSAGK